MLHRILLSRQGEVRPLWSWLAVTLGIGLLSLALLEIVLLLLAMQGIPVLRSLLGAQRMIWLLRLLP